MKRLCSRRVSSQSQECQPESVSACAIVDHLRRNLEQQTGIVIDYLFVEDDRLFIVSSRFPAPIVATEAIRIAREGSHD